MCCFKCQRGFLNGRKLPTPDLIKRDFTIGTTCYTCTEILALKLQWKTTRSFSDLFSCLESAGEATVWKKQADNCLIWPHSQMGNSGWPPDSRNPSTNQHSKQRLYHSWDMSGNTPLMAKNSDSRNFTWRYHPILSLPRQTLAPIIIIFFYRTVETGAPILCLLLSGRNSIFQNSYLSMPRVLHIQVLQN